MKVIIYGTGSGVLRVEKYLKKEHEIIGYSDSFFNEKCFKGKSFFRPDELAEIDFDYIIIGIEKKEHYEEVINKLITKGIKKEKIITFYKSYMNMYRNMLGILQKKADRIMPNTAKPFEGLILGICNARVGINPEYLDKSFYNFAVDNQDLYYNLLQLRYLREKYFERIKNMEYVIIEMCNYTYFDYDISTHRKAIDFYQWSGFRDNESHNFKYNSYFSKSISEELGGNEIEEEACTNLFNFDKQILESNNKTTGVFGEFFTDFPNEKLRNKILTNEEIENNLQRALEDTLTLIDASKESDLTIEKENIEIFCDILENIKQINNNIKIYLVLMPQHKSLEDKLRNIEEVWKNRFYNIIDDCKKVYNFDVLDLKNCEEISSVNEYYYDIGHLNYKGANKFTEILNKLIME